MRILDSIFGELGIPNCGEQNFSVAISVSNIFTTFASK